MGGFKDLYELLRNQFYSPFPNKNRFKDIDLFCSDL